MRNYSRICETLGAEDKKIYAFSPKKNCFFREDISKISGESFDDDDKKWVQPREANGTMTTTHDTLFRTFFSGNRKGFCTQLGHIVDLVWKNCYILALETFFNKETHKFFWPFGRLEPIHHPLLLIKQQRADTTTEVACPKKGPFYSSLYIGSPAFTLYWCIGNT